MHLNASSFPQRHVVTAIPFIDRYTPSVAECDAVNGVCWDFGICFLPADSEDHRGVGGDSCGGV